MCSASGKVLENISGDVDPRAKCSDSLCLLIDAFGS